MTIFPAMMQKTALRFNKDFFKKPKCTHTHTDFGTRDDRKKTDHPAELDTTPNGQTSVWLTNFILREDRFTGNEIHRPHSDI